MWVFRFMVRDTVGLVLGLQKRKEGVAVTRQSKTLDKKRQDMTRQIHQTTQDIKAIRVRVN